MKQKKEITDNRKEATGLAPWNVTTVSKKGTMRAFYWSVWTHKFWVLVYLIWFCLRLLYRALMHDMSKFSKTEREGFAEILPNLKKTTYGSQEYSILLKNLYPVLEHHYKHNRHHPEYHKNGIEDMSLLDIVEMFYDWRAATKKHADGDIKASVIRNKKRFGYSKNLMNIFRNSK